MARPEDIIRANIVSEIDFYLRPENQKIFNSSHLTGTIAIDRLKKLTTKAMKLGNVNNDIVEKAEELIAQNPLYRASSD